MAWIQLTLSSNEAHARQLGDVLMANGAQAVTYRDGKDAPIFEPGPGEVQLWEHTLVTGLFDAAHNMPALIKRLRQVRYLGADFNYKTDPLEDKDWEREWMDNFKPIQFADNLWVVPSWHEAPDPNAANILLDPGMAFGTGTHPTTALCLQWLAEQDLSGKTIVDFGCGSGILGIAALKLGAARCVGIDIDRQALIATRDNAERNGVADRFEVYLPTEQPSLAADLVVANVLAGPLQELSDVILAYVGDSALIAMSGILERQAEQVIQAYQPTINFAPQRQSEEWVLLHGQRQ
ncbi:50S ribosomal protein L11 methyltransferase [Aliidiomarina minuta]|uniref:Ribosomal protein L11 methyltransferase n=1 Tax=Aliidiomarina minuta TaxID=880057 RepID=A0A432W455_9GAMM|nr:50S ribosomal protein L11 methyltransferase [Aliidiomarina minuta]RUO24096.1 50S ribosomal protein L11 methyltransferase [Aliidiomarina minuta]